jgi:hypothetical protein
MTHTREATPERLSRLGISTAFCLTVVLRMPRPCCRSEPAMLWMLMVLMCLAPVWSATNLAP